MAWNEPGGDKGGGDRDPWRKRNQGPDLDATVKRLREKFGRFGGGGPVYLIIGLTVLWLLFSSWTVIQAREVGIVLRFGEYTRTLQPGFHLKMPWPIENVAKVATTQVRSMSDHVRMLTGDENLLEVDFNVQYVVKNARDFLFSMRDPGGTLKQAAEAAVRSVVGSSDMDTVLSGKGADLVARTRQLLQSTLDSYQSGIAVTEVSFQNVSPPGEVKAAFDDVNKAREDKQRIENEARAYASKVIPEARGQAARIAAEAAGYKEGRIAKAKGSAASFELILDEYQAAPKVTRERLWLETMEQVLSNNRKVVDASEGRNVLYLSQPGSQARAGNNASPAAIIQATDDAAPTREIQR